MTCLRWILGYVRLEIGAKSASLETDILTQRYALIAVHAAIGAADNNIVVMHTNRVSYTHTHV